MGLAVLQDGGLDFGDLTREDWAQILAYGSIGLFVSLSIPSLFRGRIMAGVLALAFWTALLFALVVGYSYRDELQSVSQRVLAVVFPGTVVETGLKEVTVFRRPDGQFSITGGVGAARVSFILDTGASTIVLRAEDATRLGIPVKRLAYDIPVSTANGHALTAAVALPELRIGSIVERDVDALIARPGALHENLLGMSFLNNLASFTFSSNKLILRGK